MNDTTHNETETPQRNGEAGRLLGAAPCSAFRCVVSDPPWWPRLHRNTVGRREGKYRAGPQRYYPLLEVEQIEEMSPQTAAKCHLWLWVLNQHVDWGYRVARAWGFEPQQMLTWCKPGLGIGQMQCNSESVLLCRKGGPTANAFGKTGGTWFEWPRGRHSEKPDDFFALVEHVSPGPRLEMFARRKRPGWQSWGNEVASDVILTPNIVLKCKHSNFIFRHSSRKQQVFFGRNMMTCFIVA